MPGGECLTPSLDLPGHVRTPTYTGSDSRGRSALTTYRVSGTELGPDHSKNDSLPAGPAPIIHISAIRPSSNR
jgi:hypothetical protein